MPNWTRNELLQALHLYCRTPFGRIHNRNPEVVALAQHLGRTPSAVSYKLANFASLDPTLDRKGAGNISKLDREVWEAFFAVDGIALQEAQHLLAPANTDEESLPETEFPLGTAREQVVQTRVQQGFFRQMVLASYDYRCCLTGIDVPEVLVASHIVPWAAEPAHRLNPHNGLCLNALHDRAFDRGLFTLTDHLEVQLSATVLRKPYKKTAFLQEWEGKVLTPPSKFAPLPSFLAWHRAHVFVP